MWLEIKEGKVIRPNESVVMLLREPALCGHGVH